MNLVELIPKLHKAPYGGLKSKPARMYIEARLPSFLERTGINFTGITCQYDPNKTDRSEAWRRYQFDLENLLIKLRDFPDTAFLIVCIEAHTGSKNKTIKELARDAEQESKTTDKEETPEEKTERKHSEEEEAKSLLAYPHLHGVIGHYNLKGNLRTKQEYQDIIYNIFPDIMIGSKKAGPKKKDDPQKALMYILKNARHQGVWELTGGRTLILGNLSGDEEVNTFFRELSIKLESPIYNMLCRYIPITGIVNAVTIKDEDGINKSITVKKIEDNKLEAAISYVKMMMEFNNIAVFKRKIYFKIKESRSTWSLYGDADLLLNQLTTIDKVSLLANLHDKLIKLIEANGQMLFPTILLTSRWIEFKDFFFNTEKGIITNTAIKYSCYKYHPEITYKMVEESDCSMIPNTFLSVLANSNLDKNENFFRSIYTCLIDKKHKSKVLTLVGPKNTGKTTIVDIIRNIYPLELITGIGKGMFNLAALVDKDLCSIDDDLGFKSLDLSEKKKIFEGDSAMIVNEKYKPLREERINTNVIFTTNDMDWLEPKKGEIDKIDPALRIRIEPFEFMCSFEKPDVQVRIDAIFESVKTLFFLAKRFFMNRPNGKKGFYICNTNEEIEEILYDKNKTIHQQLKLVIKTPDKLK